MAQPIQKLASCTALSGSMLALSGDIAITGQSSIPGGVMRSGHKKT
jgi:hypothetical protein